MAHYSQIAKAKADAAEDVVKALITTLGLVTDTLLLSMHFFHPIQQCAQQVYHTALCLSPTSSPLRNSYSWGVADNHQSPVTAFSGAPGRWGLLLRTIDVRPRQLVCIATSAQTIVAACEDIVNIYDAITFVPRQSLCIPETVTKIQGTPDGSTLFFAHSQSITMWDVQTGGLTHTFTTQSKITDIVVSVRGDCIACGTLNGIVRFWDIDTKVEGGSFGDGQPVVAICWLSSQELAVATQSSVYIHDIAIGRTSASPSILGRVWGMVYSPLGWGELLVGTSQLGKGVGQELPSFANIRHKEQYIWKHFQGETSLEGQYLGLLQHPTLVGDEIVCITPPSGVQSFNAQFHNPTRNPPLLDATMSVAVLLNRNLVAQTKGSIQIFSLNVLRTGNTSCNIRTSHIYPLGEEHIICLLQPKRHLTILKLRSLQELHPDDNTLSLVSLPTNQSLSAHVSFSCGFVAEFGVSAVMEAWQSGNPLPRWTEETNEDAPLSGLSPDHTQIVTFYGSPRWELCVKNAKNGTMLAKLSLTCDSLGKGKVYDVKFDSKTRFHLKIDGPGRHVQVPHEIIPSLSRHYPYAITKGRPMRLSEPQAIPTYTLDANCEWVIDAESRKICWISPGNVRRGNGGHFWAGLSLVMVGGDGDVRKLTFREPNS
jgi:WD40 repeat protein